MPWPTCPPASSPARLGHRGRGRPTRLAPRAGTAAEGATIKEGSFVKGKDGRLCQIIDGTAVPIEIRRGKGGDGITLRAAKIIHAFMPIRDAVRDVLRAQASGRPWAQAQIKLRTAYSSFIRYYGPINHTVISTLQDPETGEEREVHRRPNLAHFADDPDCWLVASIEDYDLDTGIARKGPIFDQRVVSPPATPLITSAADALAVTLNEVGPRRSRAAGRAAGMRAGRGAATHSAPPSSAIQ